LWQVLIVPAFPRKGTMTAVAIMSQPFEGGLTIS
jgi:hypothetical protein